MIKKLALTLPGPAVGGNLNVSNYPGFDFKHTLNPFAATSLADVISGFLDITFFIVGFLLLAWLSWGIFQYIVAGGKKEDLAKARARITYALVGFAIVVLAFAISKYAQEIFPSQTVQVKDITPP